MMSKYLLLHTGFGSMAEASRARMVIGPVGNVDLAIKSMTAFVHTNCPDYADEMWFTVLDTKEQLHSLDAMERLKDEYGPD
jgi:hypothetical protein